MKSDTWQSEDLNRDGSSPWYLSIEMSESDSSVRGGQSLGKGGNMKPNTNEDELRLRRQFDFSGAVIGKYHERYKKGQTVHMLREESVLEDPLEVPKSGSTREMGKQVFESQIRAAGLRWKEPAQSADFDYILYQSNENGAHGGQYPVKLKTSANDAFSLHKTDVRSPHSLIAYVWQAQSPEESVIYALTYDEA